MVLNRESIMKARDCKLETVTVEEWGGDVNIRRMSAQAVIEMMTFLNDKKKANPEDQMLEYTVQIVSKTLCDDNGDCFFDSEEGRVELAKKSNHVLIRLMEIAQGLNKAKTVDEAAKPSEEAPAASSSDSPSDSAAPSESCSNELIPTS